MISISRRWMVSLAATAALMASTLTASAQDDMPVIRAAVLKIGTVNWELDTITRNGFDKANGFTLAVQPFADNGATRVALEGGEADLAVADWIWVARQRAAGKDYVFIPYSKAVGGVVVPQDSSAQSLADLAGGSIGIAGGPLDKSWLILRAYAQQEYGLDLKAETEQVFGAPPLIFKSALSGETDGAINFWHFLAKMKAGGMRELISVEEASVALGLDPEVPLLGYVMKESFLAENPGIAQALYQASRDAKTLLREDDAAWDVLRPMMNANNDAQFESLRTDFRAGIPAPGPINAEGADKLLQLMAKLGGADLVGDATTLPAGLFAPIE
ncbi:ABC transporter substrate-binding protein [Yoonia sediminilitoris]|uniref:NitT/TauT family transport system substrate-binding protein n=1 Tax=Yoonia sediminilitoris TaxID=1286148 RepID=A0A2T6KS73_9RHOB|nr:NitT/TauT family transport system substrate-binding protein [Yoonia sediminilitoris]RCW99588.1 NitT/TauT family transport system substrate-binding protein [Yoonia sediminilitoris]